MTFYKPATFVAATLLGVGAQGQPPAEARPQAAQFVWQDGRLRIASQALSPSAPFSPAIQGPTHTFITDGGGALYIPPIGPAVDHPSAVGGFQLLVPATREANGRDGFLNLAEAFQPPTPPSSPTGPEELQALAELACLELAEELME